MRNNITSKIEQASVHNWSPDKMADSSESKSKKQKIDSKVRNSNILDLPNEILHKIFSMLPIFSIHHGLAPVCEHFRIISEIPEFAPHHLELKINHSFEEVDPFVASEFTKVTIESPMEYCVLEIPEFENVDEFILKKYDSNAPHTYCVSYGSYSLKALNIWDKFPNLMSLEIHAGYSNDVSLKNRFYQKSYQEMLCFL